MFKWISELSTYAKVATVFISFGVGVVGGVAAYNKWIIGRHDQEVQAVRQVQKPIGIQPKKKFDFCLHNIKTLHIFAGIK